MELGREPNCIGHCFDLHITILLCGCNVTLYSEFKWSQVLWTYSYLYQLCFDLSRHFHCLLCVLCMNQVIYLDHVMIRMCSIFGMNTIVTMVCYGMYLSLI